MKKWIAVILALALVLAAVGAGADRIAFGPPTEPLGEVPEAFADTVERNLFGEIDPRCRGRRLFSIDDSEEDKVVITRLDETGHPIASCALDCAGMSLVWVQDTSDGGFIAALGHIDVRDNEQIRSALVKFDAAAETEWICPLEGVNRPMLRYLFETDEGYDLIGTWEYPETKVPGVLSPAGVGCLVISRDGGRTDTRVLGGSYLDTLLDARETTDGYRLVVDAKSPDGDFAPWITDAPGGTCLLVSVDGDFRITDAAQITESEAYEMHSMPVGILDGMPVYDGEGILEGYEPGVPVLAVDCVDFRLIVSYQYLEGQDEGEWDWICETIYSAWDRSGALLWRAVCQWVEAWDEGEDGG